MSAAPSARRRVRQQDVQLGAVVAGHPELVVGRAGAAFAGGVGAASGGWHLALSLAAGHARRRMTPRAMRGLTACGRLGVLAIAAHLASAT